MIRFLCTLCLLLCTTLSSVYGWNSLGYYFDSRDFNTLALQTVSEYELGSFTLWGFTDIHSTEASASRADLNAFFTEYRLTREVVKDAGFQIELNDASDTKAILRYGVFKRITHGKTDLELRILPVESDNRGGQVSMSYTHKFTDKVSLTGFYDMDIENNKQVEIVSESEIAIELTPQKYALIEFRYNDYMKDKAGIAIGGRILL